MRKLQNTLYITTQGSYLHKERETLVVEQERKKVAQLPVHSIGHIFCFGNVLVSPFLLGFCGENNVNLAFFTENGRYLGRLQGRQSGNVLLRRAQYRVSEQNLVPIARNIIAAKIQASKRVLQRQIRNYGENAAIQSAVDSLNISLRQLKSAAELDVVRGIEGDAAARYFGVFGLLLSEKSGFVFDGRNRLPPRDGVNALLSFCTAFWARTSAARCKVWGWIRRWVFCMPTVPVATVWRRIFWKSSVHGGRIGWCFL
ncbi:CRISPR-associated endonuclease Cas1 [Cardiobacterium valvarum F0432]|uniref:CRISPR-associated endonuclease Cas1 n=1 Tax=Cardiobacterium valvarum F0432 TaxID=797473 RepID=G9ZJ74_9GAMM|nr:CRISPR-associated endonuclease Cas1 [Cardiobacterium valvarum F0432]